MSPSDSLDALRVHLRSIPQVRAMQVDVDDERDGRLCLSAPLAPNVNDKGSAFGGSLVSLMTLAGWALATRRLAQAGLKADVYVADSQVRYLAPLHADLRAEAWLEEGDWDTFVATFRQRGRARCRIAACVRLPGGEEATVFSGRFVALAAG
ncbi:YiiD C-terminal domain-containing protein [Pseudoxanthomonas sp. 10H]|uniref:YiiD C-terminal domain-containing protein n=1 Tax=Pseudoxanthomonas sp. 10H TaxID=3242729 RepID=UPI003558AAA6